MRIFSNGKTCLAGQDDRSGAVARAAAGNGAYGRQSGPSPRLAAEVQLLRQAAGGRSQVIAGPKVVDGRHFTAVLITNVRLSTTKFDVTTTDMLFLLPPDYPRLPPIGCYLNYKWKTADHHFTLQSYHGAPHLREQGWYWYCVGLGGRFDVGGGARSWRPAARPENGHNLATLFIAARHAINHEE